MMLALLILARSSLSPRSLSLSSKIRFNHFELLNNFPYNHIHFDFKLFDVFVGNPRLTFSTTKSTRGFLRRFDVVLILNKVLLIKHTEMDGGWLVGCYRPMFHIPLENIFAHMHMETSTLSVKDCKSYEYAHAKSHATPL